MSIGRPSKLHQDIVDDIVAEARSHPFDSTPKELKHKLDLDVSARTVRRRLDENGIVGRIAADEYDYSDRQLQHRQAFGEGYEHFTVEDWKRILFSDEKKFTVDSETGIIHVQRPVGKKEMTITSLCSFECLHDDDYRRTV